MGLLVGLERELVKLDQGLLLRTDGVRRLAGRDHLAHAHELPIGQHLIEPAEQRPGHDLTQPFLGFQVLPE